MNKKTPNGFDSLCLSNTDQRETEPTPETKSDKIDDNSVQTLTPNTPKGTPQFPIQTETPLLQNVKQILKPSAQQKTLTFEKFETLLIRHLEKRLTEIQEKFESYFEKISKTVANIERCQNQNTKILQQNIANLKNELLPKNEIITTPINKQTDLLEKSKSHAIIQKSPQKDKHRYNQRSQQENLQKSQIQQNQTQKSPQGERKHFYRGFVTKSSFERNMKSAGDSIYSPTENNENDHPYHKDTSIVGSDTINHHSRYKQSKRPEVVVNRFPENQHTF